MQIVGRQKEQKVIKNCLESPRPEFLALYGRRRVGKTYLVRESLKERIVFSFTGAAKAGKTKQLALFDEAMETYGKPVSAPTRDWLEAFKRLRLFFEEKIAETDEGQKFVIFIDELPWLATHKSGIVSALEHFWNSWGSACPQLLLVVCGSATSWIIDNIINEHGGLHNRVTRKLCIEPFNLDECEEYYRYRGIVMSRMQIAEVYMILGGIPYYMDYLEKEYSPAQNIDNLFFVKDAPLANEYRDLYASLFKKPENHLLIIKALGSTGKGMVQKELEKATGIKAGGTLTKALSELEQCGFIRLYRDFSTPGKDFNYQLIDFFSLFYLKHISSARSSDTHYWRNQNRKGGQNAWNGLAFERVCIAHCEQIRQRLGILGVFTGISAWRSRHSSPAVQIDMVLDRDDGIINLCEIKFTSQPLYIDAAMDSAMRIRRETFRAETCTKKALHTTLVSANGLSEGSYRGEFQGLVVLDDLFNPIMEL